MDNKIPVLTFFNISLFLAFIALIVVRLDPANKLPVLFHPPQ